MSLIVILVTFHISCKFHQSTPDELKPRKYPLFLQVHINYHSDELYGLLRQFSSKSGILWVSRCKQGLYGVTQILHTKNKVFRINKLQTHNH